MVETIRKMKDFRITCRLRRKYHPNKNPRLKYPPHILLNLIWDLPISDFNDFGVEGIEAEVEEEEEGRRRTQRIMATRNFF